MRAGWVYLGSTGEAAQSETLDIELQSVKGTTQQAAMIKKAQDLFRERLMKREVQSDRMAVWASGGIMLTAIIAPLIWYYAIPSMTIMAALRLSTAILVAVCPARSCWCSLWYSMYASQLADQPISIAQQAIWSDLAADPSKVVFCWDRTNTLVQSTKRRSCRYSC